MNKWKKKMRKLGEKTGEFLWRRNLKRGVMSRSLTVDSILFSLLFYFTFLVFFSFIFLFLEQLRLGVISHAVTSVTS